MRPSRGVNLTAFDQEIPHDLLKTAVVARHGRRAASERALQLNALCVGGRLHRRDRILDDRRHVGRLHSQPRLAQHDARDIEHILDNLRQRGGVAIDHVQRLRNFLVRQLRPTGASGHTRAPRSAACAARATASRETRPSNGWRSAAADRTAPSRWRGPSAWRGRCATRTSSSEKCRPDSAFASVMAPSVRSWRDHRHAQIRDQAQRADARETFLVAARARDDHLVGDLADERWRSLSGSRRCGLVGASGSS